MSLFQDKITNRTKEDAICMQDKGTTAEAQLFLCFKTFRNDLSNGYFGLFPVTVSDCHGTYVNLGPSDSMWGKRCYFQLSE